MSYTGLHISYTRKKGADTLMIQKGIMIRTCNGLKASLLCWTVYKILVINSLLKSSSILSIFVYYKIRAMKTKKLYLILFSFLPVLYLNAQVVPNGGFENWTTKILYEDPVPYLTTNLNVFFSAGFGNVTKSTDHHGGNYAARLETYTNGTDTMFGGLFIGTPGNNGISGGEPLATHPDSIRIFAKYNVMTNDTAYAMVMFKDSGAMIGYGAIALYGAQPSFTEFKSKVIWLKPYNSDTIVVILTSSNLNGARIPGSVVYFDDLSFSNSTAYPYGDFETWNTVSSEEPDNWFSFNYACSPGNYSAVKTSVSYEGSWALKLKNVVMASGDTMGYITNGKFGNNGPQGGMPVTLNPNLVMGYYKYLPAGLDTALVAAMLYRHNPVNDSAILLEAEMIHLPPVSTYTQFSIPIFYNGTPLADTLNITFAAGNYQGNFVGVGSELYIDKLEVNYNPVSVNENETQQDIRVFPNPSHGLLNIDMDKSPEVLLELYNENGAKVYSETLKNTSTSNKLNLSGLSKGIYYLKMTSTDKTVSKKIIIQ
jgi:hypothetical protein